MAWLQNLAGRAEDLLNRLDQNAAVALNEPPLSKDVFSEINETNEIRNLQTSASVPNLTYLDRDSRNVGGADLSFTDNNKSSAKAFPELFSDSILEELSSNTSCLSEDFNKIEDLSQAFDVEEKLLQEPYDFDTEFKSETSRENLHVGSIVVQDSLTLHSNEEKFNLLERENTDLNKQLLNLQHNYAELQQANIALQGQLERASDSAQLAQQEMVQYRARAQKVLQEKEKLIALKQEFNTDKNKDEDLEATISCYNDELKKEINFEQQKNKKLTEKFENLKDELVSLQQQQVASQQEILLARQSLQQSLLQERRARAAAEDDARLKTKELQTALQQISDHKNEIVKTSQELEQMQEKIKQRPSHNGNNETESRLQSLTQTLLVKQNAISSLTTERNALRLQLEKIQKEYGIAVNQLQRSQVKIVNMNDTDDVKSQVPKFLIMSPFDVGMTKRVKNAYSTLDAISVRTGVFLRRYPLARVFVFFYMVLLHLWVLIILFTYIPSSSK